MSFALHGQAVSRGIVIGRAVVMTTGRVDVAHYFIETDQVGKEIRRLVAARDAVAQEIRQLQSGLANFPASDAPAELTALLDVHLMLLEDQALAKGVSDWIVGRHYNAEWALTAQFEVISRQFDEMEDPYLRERKADLEQVGERLLAALRGEAKSLFDQVTADEADAHRGRTDVPPVLADKLQPDDSPPLVLVARDLSPSDLLQFKQSVFGGFVTEVGGKTSHTAIVARGLDIPAVVGARQASQLIRQDDWIIIDGDEGVVIIDPSPLLIEEYFFKQRQGSVERERLHRLRHTPSVTLDGAPVQLMANIELPADAEPALQAGAVGVGLFRTEFLFMGRTNKGLSQLPDEAEQFTAYKAVLEAMHGLPVTIRTIDIGADKPLERGMRPSSEDHLNPALGLRAIRWCLAEPAMFLVQLRAILRAAAFGPVNLLVPMLAHVSEIKQTLLMIDRARAQLDSEGLAYGPVRLGAMIEVPAAALMVDIFLEHFDFLSIGTNDLIQYTLAVDRVDQSVTHLYDPWHPAVLGLIAQIIARCQEKGKDVSVCGEMAGDVTFTAFLLGLGLRNLSMHPTQIPAVKQQILRSHAKNLEPWSRAVLDSADPQSVALT